ncbi:hypothetical protein WJX72_002198 [[Myrmecia] bisecta]|uniref:Kinetochore protein SPC25 n=1 Tax=[Myrmecia] bisecta TaxID=41462 RepID=A0AAW1QPE9_9CHLO
MAGRLDVDTLDDELAGVRKKFERWATHKLTSLEDLRRTHLEAVSVWKDNIQALERRQEELSLQAGRLRQRLETERGSEAALQAELAVVQAEQAALPKQISKLQEALAHETNKLSHREAAIADETLVKEKKLEALRQAVQVYRCRLGLEFKHTNDSQEELQLVFTQIDRQHTEREFMFAVRVMDENQYEVTKCNPEVDALPALLQRLNESKNFSKFVRGMRRHFQQLV